MSKQSKRSTANKTQKPHVVATNTAAAISKPADDAGADAAPNLAHLVRSILWTIYTNPSDAPGRIVLRPHACLADGRVIASKRNWVRDTIEECRSLIPKSARRLRIGDPNPDISEVWMQQIKAQKAT